MSWRYQVVMDSQESLGVIETTYSLCEIHVNDNEELEGWTRPSLSPSGETLGELTMDICRMMVDAYCWEPVAVADLKPGMQFVRKATLQQREAVASMVRMAGHNLNEATK